MPPRSTDIDIPALMPALQPCWAAAVGSRRAGEDRVIPGCAWELWDKQQPLTNQAAYIIETFPEEKA